jgi:hypothetical protein
MSAREGESPAAESRSIWLQVGIHLPGSRLGNIWGGILSLGKISVTGSEDGKPPQVERTLLLVPFST